MSFYDYLIKGAVAAGEKFEAKDLKAILANSVSGSASDAEEGRPSPLDPSLDGKTGSHRDLVGEESEEFKEEFNIDRQGMKPHLKKRRNVVPDGERNRVIGMGTGKGAGRAWARHGHGPRGGTDTKNTPSSKKPQLFDFFQKALSLEYVKLTDKERGIFEKQALDWQKSGPDGEEKKRAAEKYVALWIDQFAQDIFTQFGAQICVFLSYKDSADTHNISIIGRNDHFGAGTKFKCWARSAFERSGLLERWGQYTTNLLPSVTLPDASVGNLIDLPLKGRAEWLAPEASIASVPDRYPPYVYFAKVT
ncbi:hypothetical protein FA13DRAFT_1807113 [Coprinellus micaceus]|uniref:Uncharacterized protein n=1 Tax=Coprinellus micaceus TaxID=71717 RepID=A0A4Y7RBP5_COPMI|nr:hypothetical protein FA13DRAFT_1807113 [Coprinellus micaceus]